MQHSRRVQSLHASQTIHAFCISHTFFAFHTRSLHFIHAFYTVYISHDHANERVLQLDLLFVFDEFESSVIENYLSTQTLCFIKTLSSNENSLFAYLDQLRISQLVLYTRSNLVSDDAVLTSENLRVESENKELLNTNFFFSRVSNFQLCEFFINFT